MNDEVDENMESTGDEGEYERTGGIFSLGIKQLADIREMVKRHMNAKLRAQDILNLSEDLRPGYSLRYYDSDSGCIKNKRVYGLTGTIKKRFCTADGNKNITNIYGTKKPEDAPREERKVVSKFFSSRVSKCYSESTVDTSIISPGGTKGTKGGKRQVLLNSSPKKPREKPVERGNSIHRYIFHLTECVVDKTISDEKRRKTYCKATGDSDMSLSQIVGDSFDCSCKDLVEKKPGECSAGIRKKVYPWTGFDARDGNVFIDYLKNDLRLQPIVSELPMYWKGADFATKIDLMCVDSMCDLVLISLKTGVLGTEREKGDSGCKMKGIWSEVPDRVDTRHDLQMLIEMGMLTNVYSLDVRKALIVYVTENPVVDDAPDISIRGVNSEWMGTWTDNNSIPELIESIVQYLEGESEV